MIIRTTANIDIRIEERIREAAKFCGIKPQLLASVLLKIMIKEKPLEFRSFCPVKYQARRDKDLWNKFHLELTGAVYESSIDLRKLMKRSVSYLLTYAAVVYLERAVDEILRGEVADNYPETYTIFTHHSQKKSTFTAYHTVPDPNIYPDHERSST